MFQDFKQFLNTLKETKKKERCLYHYRTFNVLLVASSIEAYGGWMEKHTETCMCTLCEL